MRKSIALLMLLGLTSTSLVACGGDTAGGEGDEEGGSTIETPVDGDAPVAAPNDDGGTDDDQDDQDDDDEGDDS